MIWFKVIKQGALMCNTTPPKLTDEQIAHLLREGINVGQIMREYATVPTTDVGALSRPESIKVWNAWAERARSALENIS